MSVPTTTTTLERLQVVTNNTTGGRDTLTLENIPTSWKIVDLKRHLVSKMNIVSSGNNDNHDENSKIGRLRLIFRGQPLQDETLLSSVSGLTSGTTMHVLIRPAAPAAATSSSSSNNNNNTNTNNSNNLNAQLDGAANQLLGSLLGGGGRNNAGGGGAGGADLGNLVGGLLQGVLGGIGNATNNNNNNTANTNTNTTRSATFGNTTVRVHDLTGNNTNNNNNNNNNRARSPGTSNNTSTNQQQQQQQQSGSSTANNTTNPRNLSLPPAMVHVHVTPEQLDSLPDQLVRFYDNFSRRTGATQSFDPARLVQIQLEQQQQNSSSPLGNLINSVSGLVSNLSGGLNNNNNQNQQQQQQQQQTSANSNEDDSVSAILSRYTNNITPAEPFVSQANFVPLKDRVSNAVKDVVAHRGVGALLPLINGDWEPLSLFRAPIENALRQPYMTSASRDSVASAIVREFQQAVSESDSSFAADGEGNPLYQVLANEMTSSPASPGEDAAPVASAVASSSSSSSPSRQIFNKIRNILLRAAMTDGLDLILPPTTTASSSSSTSTTRWSTQVRNLVVRTSGQVVNVLRNDAKLSPASIEKILKEVANLAAPLMQNMNPMMSMMVQSNGPQLIQAWANEYDANPQNYVAAATVASNQGTSSTTTTVNNNNTNNNNNNNNNVAAAAAANDDDDDDDLDALLDDAMDDYNTTSTSNTTSASNNNSSNTNQQQQTNNSSSGLGLGQVLQQVEGLDNESVQAIMRMTNQALGGNGSNNSSTSGSQENYFY